MPLNSWKMQRLITFKALNDQKCNILLLLPPKSYKIVTNSQFFQSGRSRGVKTGKFQLGNYVGIITITSIASAAVQIRLFRVILLMMHDK
jgi:hypothetical protein